MLAKELKLRVRCIVSRENTWEDRDMAKDTKDTKTDALAALARIPLGDVLEFISNELQSASEKAKTRGSATMQFEECELEFAIDAEIEGSGELKVYVLSLGNKLNRSESNTIRIKFKALDDGTVPIASLTPQNS